MEGQYSGYIQQVCARVRDVRQDLDWDVVPPLAAAWAWSNTVRVTGDAEHDAAQLLLKVNSWQDRGVDVRHVDVRDVLGSLCFYLGSA